MTTQFDEFCAQLPFWESKKKAIKRELNRFYYYSFNGNKDVWKKLYDLNIPKKGAIPKIEGKEILSMLRDYLAKKQKYRCCYCQRYLYNIAYARPIEHILPRSDFPRFSLVMKNLAVACYDCNLKKSNAVWWCAINPAGAYPVASQLAAAFHCNHHAYNDHISWMSYATNDFAFSAYGGITAAGKKLCLDLLHDISKTDILLSRNDGLREVLEDLKTMNENGLEGDSVRAFVNELQGFILASTEAS
ncbi:TPA: hypothetical protein OTT09_003570 [Enterobacter asburiae]|jgi:5-methylcytosine-specific restriction endonuclease McrA|nr:hypothetical protein [Enterobacter asburiae]